MAHPEQFFFIHNLKAQLGQYFVGTKVLEIGSLDINGSVRVFFENCDYTGIDVGDGKHVDVVCPGEDYGMPSSSFDVIISCEAMEHNFEWKKTWLNMLRMAKDDGLVIMTCAAPGRKQHGTEQFKPGDSPLTIEKGRNYYRNMVPQDFEGIVSLDEWFSLWSFQIDNVSHDLYFFGVCKGASEQARMHAASLKAGFTQYYHNKNVIGAF